MKRRIDSLKAHPAQAKIYPITETAVANLADNIAQLGQLEPAIITPDNILLSGYTRLAALKSLGKKSIDVKIIDVPKAEQVFYIISANHQRVKDYVCRLAEIEHLEKHFKKQMKVGRPKKTDIPKTSIKRAPQTIQLIAKALNMSTTTIHRLQYIKKHYPSVIPHIGTDITLTSAYSQIKLQANQREVVEETKQSRKVKYAGDRFTIYRKPAQAIPKTLEEDKVDCILTSPPYWAQRRYTGNANELGNEKNLNDYIDNLVEIVSGLENCLKPSGTFYLNLGDTYKDGVKMQVPEQVSIAISTKTNFKLRNTLIWAKNYDGKVSAAPESTTRRRHTDYEYIYEFIYFYCLDRKKYKFNGDAIRQPYNSPAIVDNKSVRHHQKSNSKTITEVDFKNIGPSIRNPLGRIPGSVIIGHSNTKNPIKNADIQHTAYMPVGLVEELLKPVVEEGDIVLDPFAGSSSTGVAALGLGAEFIGFEVNNKFAQLSQQRLNEFSKSGKVGAVGA